MTILNGEHNSSRRMMLAASLALWACSLNQSPCRAQVADSTKVTPDERAIAFGDKVAVTDEHLFVSSLIEVRPDLGSKVYVFTRASGWSQSQTLSHSFAESDDIFGASIAVDGPFLVVGAPGNGVTGSAYVYRQEGASWVEMQRLLPSTTGEFPGDTGFGWRVAIEGGLLSVTGWTMSFLFRYDGSEWLEEAVFHDFRIMDLDSDQLIGEPNPYDPNPDVHVYRFDASSWSHFATLNPDVFLSDYSPFGHHATIQGDLALVTSHQEFLLDLYESGAVYVFRLRESGEGGASPAYELEQKLGELITPAAERQFGAYLASTRDLIIVGSSSRGRDGSSFGPYVDEGVTSYLYQRGNSALSPWQPVHTFVPSTEDFGGARVSISKTGRTAAIGRPHEDLADPNNTLGPSGAVWVYEYASTAGESNEFRPRLLLSQNYPNPFNPSTEIAFSLRKSGPVRINVYDLLGREITVLLDQLLPAGEHTVTWMAGDLPSGVYLYRMETGGAVRSRIATLLK